MVAQKKSTARKSATHRSQAKKILLKVLRLKTVNPA
ncbi:hypothetical protein NEOC65_000914 [Neochlamydia sp. AcF65]|nr:hypothetical protein [Neochlamydia sp. AcF65]MBS4171306.1 hypothetical protein [Neochlamydia sp. AcF95]